MKMFKILVSIFFIVQFAFAGNNKPIFQNTPENIDFLRYFFISNLYDSAKVIYKFGEVKLISGDNTELINLTHSLDTVEGKSRFGTSEQGVSYDLQSLARTENFQLPNTGFSKITFFRDINESGNPGKPNKYCHGYGDGKWDIADTTEFVLQLVNANYDVVMAVLDSVVSMPNSDPHADSLFGTNPNFVFQDWIVPTFLFDSTVYLRVSPRRYGHSPLGLIIKENDFWVNYGSLMDQNGASLGMENYDTIDSLCWIELKIYLDSVFLATGELPIYNYHVPYAHFNEYKQLYISDYDIRVINDDTIYYKRRYYSNFCNENKITSNGIDDMPYEENLRIEKISLERDTLFVEINSTLMTRAKIKLHSNNNKEFVEVWKGAIIIGENKIKTSIANLPTGYYSVTFEDTNNNRIYSSCKTFFVK